MRTIKSRTPFSPAPYRDRRPATSKILFLSLEGSVTEEEYFQCVSDIFREIKGKIQYISVVEDAVHTLPKFRTAEQKKMLSKARPLQLVERIEWFKKEYDDRYEFSQYPEAEFWIVTDVDNNWSDTVIEKKSRKTLRDEWQEAIARCDEKGYRYAVSNPFFEVWLLLHHDWLTKEDASFAVTDQHAYEKTSHFRERLRVLGVALKDEKHLTPSHYTAENIRLAMARAEELHKNKKELCPKYCVSTVYLLLKRVADMLPEQKDTREEKGYDPQHHI